MEDDIPSTTAKKERNFPSLELTDQATLNATTNQQPLLVIQSPKTPTLSRKLKAVSLDSDPPPKQESTLDVSRDVFSMPNTPKRQIRQKLSCDLDDHTQRSTLTPCLSSNLKKFASNTSISGSQTLKTLPEVMTLQDFSDNRTEPVKIKAKGLLERRGSNASLTIDLGSNSSISEIKPMPLIRLNTAKSASNLNLSSYNSVERCTCEKKCEASEKKFTERRKSQETCGNCIIYESVPSKPIISKTKCPVAHSRCSTCKSRRKSLSNENLYVPPCGFCQTGSKECGGTTKHCKGYRKAYYPRQPDLESSQLLSEDFKLHLQNIQYLQTAGSVLSVSDLKESCEGSRVPKLHQEFWEVPLNLQEKCYVSGSQSRNRYRGVLPNEHSRVHLLGNQAYIHANYIKGPDYTETAYIATQGPMAHTCEDFWEMIWHSHCSCIVMLTGLIEKGRSKCELYFPLGKKTTNPNEKSYLCIKTTKLEDQFKFDLKNTHKPSEEIIKFEELNEVRFGKHTIRYIREETIDECVVRELLLSRSDRPDTRTVYHYWYSNWPDHKMANPEQVLKIAVNVLNLTEARRKSDNNNASNISKTNRNCKSNESEMRFEPQHVDTSRLQGQQSLDLDADASYSNKTMKQSKNDCRVNKKQSSSFDFGSSMSGTAECKVKTTQSSIDLKESIKRRRSLDQQQKVPVVVHCSAGIGRTGCFLAILNGIRQLRSNLNVDVLAILCSLRLNRGGMVQTAEQYELIHRVLKLYTDLM